MAAEKMEREYSALKKFVCVLLCLSLLLCEMPALAVSQSEIDALEQQRNELEERRDSIAEQLAALDESREAQLAVKSALDEESELLRLDIMLVKEQAQLYSGLLESKRLEAEEAKRSEEAHYALYQSRVRDMEEHSAWSYLDFLLSSDSVSELIARLTDISDIMSRDERAREDYIAARERSEKAMAEYTEILSSFEEKREELIAQEAKLEEKIAASAAVIANLESDAESYREFYEAAEAEMEAVQAEIDRKAEELRKQQEAEAAAKAPVYTPPTVGNVSSGYYMWPSATTYITSPFGPRVHPIYGVLKPHTGVDIGAWYGSEIYAAADGTVTAAVTDYGSVGYGTYVAVYHPNGTTTLYGHMSALAVSYGQTVTKGQVIGYVGSTGASNGPHIHFEVRQNGVCVDPMQFFSF